MGNAITVAHGDGIGPEIMQATLRVLREAGAVLDIEAVEIGEKVYRAGNTAGVGDGVWESLQRTGVFLKAPITTPQGGGFKSLNVTVRKTLGLYANVRPCVAYAPFVRTLWLALRCLDAMGAFQSPSSVITSKHFVDQLVSKFNAELASGDSAASPLKMNPHENWRRQEIVDALRYGLRYRGTCQ